MLWIKEKDDGVRSAEIIPNHLQLRHSFISSGQHQEHRRDGDRTSDETWAAPGVLALTVSPKGKPRWTWRLGIAGFALVHIHRKGNLPVSYPSGLCSRPSSLSLTTPQAIVLLYLTLSYLA